MISVDNFDTIVFLTSGSGVCARGSKHPPVEYG